MLSIHKLGRVRINYTFSADKRIGDICLILAANLPPAKRVTLVAVYGLPSFISFNEDLN